MYTLSVVSENPILFGTLGFIVVFNLICIIYLVLKERKMDKEEIDDIIASLVSKTEEVKSPEPKLPIDEVLEEMQKNLETSPEEVVLNFEQDQEENSIISYQELIDALKSETPVFTEMKNELKKDLSQENTVELKEQLKETLEIIDENKKEVIATLKPMEERRKMFKATEFISPIFGRIAPRKDEKTSRFDRPKIEVEMTSKDIEKDIHSKEEVFPFGAIEDKNEEFLRSLKEFRKNLE